MYKLYKMLELMLVYCEVREECRECSEPNRGKAVH